MSKTHNEKQGDTLGAIAVRYLGSFNKWTAIVNANPQLANRKKIYDGSPTIFPGDILIIPEDETKKPATAITKKTIVLADDAEQDVSIVISGKKFTGFTGYEINLAYDTLDTFSFNAPYDRSNKELLESIMPFAFKTCDVFYYNNLIFKGRLLTPDPELIADTSEITLQGYPLCGVLNDCVVPPGKYPLQWASHNITGVADAACESYNIPVIFDGDIGADFTEVSIEPTDKILDFLSNLSKQRDLLFTNTEKGELLFLRQKAKKHLFHSAKANCLLYQLNRNSARNNFTAI
jgi:prophage tail gpP-like protein/phage tail protein X